MKNLILIIMIILLLTTTTFADIPHTLNYQGRLMGQAGQPVIDGQYSVTFRLYTAASGGTMVWEEAQSVITSNGYFNTILGNATAFTPAIFSQPLWVGVQIGTEAEMTPRQKLGTAAYALGVVDQAITADKVAKGWGIVPTGFIGIWPMSTPPEGWLECDGRSLSRSEYPELFAAIGNTYGGSAPDFNLPDFRGYFVRGWDHGAAIDPGSTSRTARGDGDCVGTKQEDELKSHNHEQNSANFVHSGGDCSAMRGVWGADNRSVGCYNTGGAETRPKNISMMYIIKK